MVANWYRSNVGTPFEVAPLPRLYQKYVGHDNNRDAYMLNMIESRVVGRTWRHWEPHIIYVHHQTAPFPTRIWLPPFAEPIATQAPPLMSRTVNMIGMAIAHGLELRGLPGATHMGTGFDAWYPGYVDYLPMLQHIASFWAPPPFALDEASSVTSTRSDVALLTSSATASVCAESQRASPSSSVSMDSVNFRPSNDRQARCSTSACSLGESDASEQTFA